MTSNNYDTNFKPEKPRWFFLSSDLALFHSDLIRPKITSLGIETLCFKSNREQKWPTQTRGQILWDELNLDLELNLVHNIDTLVYYKMKNLPEQLTQKIRLFTEKKVFHLKTGSASENLIFENQNQERYEVLRNNSSLEEILFIRISSTEPMQIKMTSAGTFIKVSTQKDWTSTSEAKFKNEVIRAMTNSPELDPELLAELLFFV